MLNVLYSNNNVYQANSSLMCGSMVQNGERQPAYKGTRFKIIKSIKLRS